MRNIGLLKGVLVVLCAAAACDDKARLGGGAEGGTSGDAGSSATGGADGGVTGSAGAGGLDLGGASGAGTGSSNDAGSAGFRGAEGGGGGEAGFGAAAGSGGTILGGGGSGGVASGGKPAWDGSLPDGMCTADGWCWVYPTAPSLLFKWLSASGPGDTWGVMQSRSADLTTIDAGVIHWDGSRFRGALGELPDLDGIVATASASSAFMLLEPKHQVRVWDGTRWSAPTALPASGTLRAVWARSASDVWMVGDAGAVVHWDGAAWQLVDAGDASHDWKAVHGSGAADVWVGGTPGLSNQAVRRFNGSSWSDMQVATEVDALWVTSATDVWAGGVGELRRWNGTLWATVAAQSSSGGAMPTTKLTRVAGSPSGRVWFNGGEQLGSGVNYVSVFWDGTTLKGYTTLGGPAVPVTYDSAFLTSARAGYFPTRASPATLWRGNLLAGSGLDGLDLARVETAPYVVAPGIPEDTPPLALLPFSDDDMLLFARSGAWRGKVGGTWTQHTEICDGSGTADAPSCGGHTLSSPLVVAGKAANDVWVVEAPGSYVSHWDGAAWSRGFVGGTVTQIASSSADTWALSGTQIFHKGSVAIWDRITTAPDAELIVAADDGALVAFSRSTRQIARYAGGSWSNIGDFSNSIGETEPLRCLRAQSSSALQAVTSNAVLTFNGSAWTSKPGPLPLATENDLGACTFSGDKVWLPAGAHGILSFDGAAWTSMKVPLTAGWNEPGRVVVSPTGGAWALFPIYGTLYAYEPGAAF
ncbi:MAG: hypothetical protein QM756_40165 [Polyangiaceae bacterium]